MKTAEEWFDEMSSCLDNAGEIAVIRKAQADALRHAAQLCRDCYPECSRYESTETDHGIYTAVDLCRKHIEAEAAKLERTP